MIIWISGNTGSGKTYLANHLLRVIDAVHLDGDEIRKVWHDLGMSKEDRWENNLRVARLANNLNCQRKNVIVSVIAPYIKLREEITNICNPVWILIMSHQRRDINEVRKMRL